MTIALSSIVANNVLLVVWLIVSSERHCRLYVAVCCQNITVDDAQLIRQEPQNQLVLSAALTYIGAAIASC
jgi:hypothetical protein